MEICNIEEHLACYCYDSMEKPLIEVIKYNNMDVSVLSLSCCEIVFVLKGKISVFHKNNMSVDIGNGHIVLLTANNTIQYKALSKSMLLIFRMNEDIQLCHTYSLDRLNKMIKTTKKPDIYATLQINSYLSNFANALLNTWEDGLKCRYYFQAKISELLIMLRAYYPEELLFHFFYYYFTPEAKFAEFIHTNHRKYTSVNELANAMKMTPQQFSRRFYSVFGEAPYGWMQREKANLIYGDICRSNKPFKEIADEYGFNIQPNFNRFCKSAFGMNPGEIRKQRFKQDNS